MQELVNRKNYILVNEFIEYEKLTKNHSQLTQKRHYSYLKHLLNWAGNTYFANVHDKEPTFIKYLDFQISQKTNGPLSRETWKKILGLTARLFIWAKLKKKDFKYFPETWIDYLTIPKHVRESEDRNLVTFEDIMQIAKLDIPLENLALHRDQAAAIFLFLSGMRASAFVTLPIEAVDMKNRSINQSTRLGVKTKNGKSQITYIYNIKPFIAIIQDWDVLVRSHLSPNSPWYAPIKNTWGIHEFSQGSPGNNRNQTLNKRLRLLFKKANLPYRSAHKFRRGHLVHGLNHAKTIDRYKAISENLMHKNITITDQYYGKLSDQDRKSKIDGLFEAKKHIERAPKSSPSNNITTDPSDNLEFEENEFSLYFE